MLSTKLSVRRRRNDNIQAANDRPQPIEGAKNTMTEG